MGLNTFPCNPYPISTEELNKGNNDDLNARVATLEEEVTDLSSAMAPEFSAEAAYTAGDIVWHEGGLYVFTADHAAGAWSTGDTQAVTVGGELATLSGDVSDLNSGKANQITIALTFNADTAYDPGDLVYHNGLTYRCVNSHEGEWDADDFAATTIANELDTLKSGLTGLNNIVNRESQVLDLTNVTVPRTNVKRYTFPGVNLTNKVVAISTNIPTYGVLDSRLVCKQTEHACKYYVEVTDENNYTWAAYILVEDGYIDIETLSHSHSPSDYPISLDYVVIIKGQVII